MRNNLSRYGKLIIFSIGFLTLGYLFTPGGTLSFSILFNGTYQFKNLLVYLLMIPFFYFNYYYLIPRIYYKKQYFFYFSIILLCVLLINFTPSLFTKHRPPDRFDHIHKPATEIRRPKSFSNFERSHAVFLFLIGTFGSLFLKAHNRLLITEKDKLNAELSFLKAQINPHFLFNTLNSIYSLSINKDDRTPGAIVQLADLMRYIIRDANDNYVFLQKEIDYINNYVALQKARLGDTALINYRVDGNLNGKQIAPLILISFVENAFKHGINPDENSVIDVSINITESSVQLYVSNKKVNTSADYTEDGLGIRNTRKRLELLYPSKHTLIIKDDDESFSIDLSLNLV